MGYHNLMMFEVNKYLRVHNKPNMYEDDLVEVATNCFENSVKHYVIGGRTFVRFWLTSMTNDFNDFFKRREKENSVSFDPTVIEASYLRFTDVEQNSHWDDRSYEHRERIFSDIVEENYDKFTDDELRFLFLMKYEYTVEQICQILTLERSKAYRIKKEIISKLNILMKNY